MSKQGFADYGHDLKLWLEKRTGPLHQMSGIEYYRVPSTGEYGFGIMYFLPDLRAFRINWKSGETDENRVASIDFWNKPTGAESVLERPDHRLVFNGDVSAARFLPAIVQVLNHPGVGPIMTKPANDVPAAVTEATEENPGNMNVAKPAAQQIGDPGATKVEYGKPLKEQLEAMEQLATLVARKSVPSLMISGGAGIGKSYLVEKSVRDVLGPESAGKWVSHTGTISPVEAYRQLYRNNGKTIVFDDIDTLFKTEEGRNVLKGALDTKPVRSVAWLKRNPNMYDPKVVTDPAERKRLENDHDMVPNKFDYNGSVIFISNKPITEIDPDGAIASRSLSINLTPNPKEVLEYMEHILPFIVVDVVADNGQTYRVDAPIEVKKKVLDIIKKNPNARDITLRKLVRALAIYIKERKRMSPEMLENILINYT